MGEPRPEDFGGCDLLNFVEPVAGGGASLEDAGVTGGGLLDHVVPSEDAGEFSLLDYAEPAGEYKGGERGRRGGRGGVDARAHTLGGGALEGMSTTSDECAENTRRLPGAPCACDNIVGLMREFLEAEAARGGRAGGRAGERTDSKPAAGALLPTTGAGADAVREAAARLGCRSESCILVNAQFRRFARSRGHTDGELNDELETRFKAAGPRESLALLNNTNIDETMRRWALVFPEFHPCPFAMMDFDRTGEAFAVLDFGRILAGGASCVGCVVNTDNSTGPGKHWVAVFVDCRPEPPKPWTVEYFNSVGRPPPKAMVGWMARTRAALEQLRAGRQRRGGAAPTGAAPVLSVAVTDVDHQTSQTECGLYSLFYIRRRLEGTPYSFFQGVRIPDADMSTFRTHIFRAR